MIHLRDVQDTSVCIVLGSVSIMKSIKAKCLEVLTTNYNYLSVKYASCKRDWYCDVVHLLGKI